MMEFSQSVNVLGTEYRVFVGDENQFPKLKIMNGYTDASVKEIVVDCMKDAENDIEAKKDIHQFQRQVLKHEIVHAFLYESGLKANSHSSTNWALDEEMVDWFAIQGEKIHKAWQEVGCLG